MIAGYLRVSSDKQDVQRQRESISRFGQVDEWFEDSTGRNPRDLASKRAGFQRLLKAVESGLVERIIVDSQDRFGTRDSFEFGSFITLLRNHNCALFDASGKELSADDDANILTTTLGALTSAREQKEKANRNISGKLVKAKAGEYQGGYPPFGMDVVCINDDREKWRTVYYGHFRRIKLFPDGRREQFDGKGNSPRKDLNDTLVVRPSIETDRIKIVQDIFYWYATESISPRQITTRLRQMGADGVFGPWDKQRISGILCNPTYAGTPTWNKRGGGRFSEFVGGRIQAVPKVSGKAKSGRRRPAGDFIQGGECPPIVDRKTFDIVQSKLTAAKTGARGPTKAAELWLRPFLICGHCEKPMHAGRQHQGYFCSTYARYGGPCRCHRIRHSVLEAEVVKYLHETSPKVLKILNAKDKSSVMPLMEAIVDIGSAYWSVQFDIEKAGGLKAYGKMYDRLRPKAEKAIAVKEKELDRLIAGYADLKGAVRERAQRRLDELQAEIEDHKRKLVDLRIPLISLKRELSDRLAACSKAEKALAAGNGRAKTEALRSVIDRIVLHFRYFARKSTLEKIEIVPIGSKLGPS